MWTNNLDEAKWADSSYRVVWQNRLRSLTTFLLASLSPVFKGPARENKIAYLDGLRGFAAMVVYCTHHQAFSHGAERRLNHAYGFRDEYLFASLPIVRLFFVGGAFAVALFFVISGYALSVSPMTLIHTQAQDEALRLTMNIGSSFPRRWIRLYLPVAATTFLFFSSWHIFRIETVRATPRATYLEEFGKWLNEFREGSYVYLQSEAPGFGHAVNHHMWSIAVEYRGSVMIYVAILTYFALGYGPSTRFWAGLGLFFYFQFIADGPYYALFVMGLLLCDVDLGLEKNPSKLPRMLRSELLESHSWIYHVFLLIGLYLGSAPSISDAANLSAEPGWGMLSYLVPWTQSNARWYFCVYSAIICVICVPRIPWLKSLFESAVFQYLGKISFGFYLVHGPIMWTIGDRLNAAVGRPRGNAEERAPGWTNIIPISDAGPLGLEMNAIVPHLILLPLTLWMGGVVTKLIDLPSVRLSKWLFRQRNQHSRSSEAQSEMGLMANG